MGLVQLQPIRAATEAASDQQRLAALIAGLDAAHPSFTTTAKVLVEGLRKLLSLDAAILYRVAKAGKGGRDFSLVNSHSSGLAVPHKLFARELESAVREMPAGWDLFNPHPSRQGLRERALIVPPARSWAEGLQRFGAQDRFGFRDARELESARGAAEKIAQRLDGTGLGAAWQLRVLISGDDGSIVFAGGFRESAPGPREVALFDALLPALRRRFEQERQLERGAMFGPALGAALEQISRAAFIIDEHGALIAGNAAGVRQHQRGVDGAFTVTEIALANRQALRLVVAPPEEEDEQRLSEISTRLELTQRQTEVLQLLVRGESNRSISGRLGCARRTVEAHVTAMLKKAQVDSRAMLVARHFSRR